MRGLLALLAFGLLAGMLQGGLLQAQEEKTFTNDLGMEFTLLPAGSFMMGIDPQAEEGGDDETPRHRVTISTPFYLGKYEVTQREWEKVMGNNPSEFKGRSNPVEQVSWAEVQVFIEKLNENESGGTYRLPTEAEWEYAARAGADTFYFFGNDPKDLGKYAWYNENEDYTGNGHTHPVGRKQPNPWGLYDIYGNVFEWVEDWFGEKYYDSSPETDPEGPPSGSRRVYRGGSWYIPARGCRSGCRDSGTPDFSFDDLGFRLAFSPGQ